MVVSPSQHKPAHARSGDGRRLLQVRGVQSGRTVHSGDGSRDFGNAGRLLGASCTDRQENCRNALRARHNLMHLAAGGAGQFGPSRDLDDRIAN
jgi:hypothetical protein